MPYATQPTLDLLNILRHQDGLDPASAELAVIFGAAPNALLLDLRQPELEGFTFSALAYAAHTALGPGCTQVQRLALLQTLIDMGADRANAAGKLLAVYSDLWQSHPATARRMVIGLHTLTTAVEPYIAGCRTLPAIPTKVGNPPTTLITRDGEVPF